MKKLVEWLIITAGTLCVSVGIYFFKFPNNFSTGGVSGISVILGGLIPAVSSGTFVLVINALLLLIGFIFLGKSFGIKTAYCSMLMSISIYLLEWLCPLTEPMTKQPVLELAFSIILPAVGSAILFNWGASTGGTDIVAMLMKKYTSLDIGKALLATDTLIVFGSFAVFGIETGLFSFLGLLGKSLVVDGMIESLNVSKYFTIITSHADEIKEYINKELHRGATICDCTGSYTNDEKKLILTVLYRSQALQLKNYVKSVDKSAFIVIANTSNVIGKGFRNVM
ncbi:MAG: YitT family protein [Ruminococcaceae bacterium]|nr:YitT family protein [Oscillospiraceae bacterium]